MSNLSSENRPLSPHMGVYRPQVTSVFSILHRVTGVGMTLSAFLIVWWFLAAASGAEYFAIVDGFLTSWFGRLILIASCWALWYHFCNGVRHLIWDLGYGFEIESVTRSAWIVLGASIALTILTLIIA